MIHDLQLFTSQRGKGRLARVAVLGWLILFFLPTLYAQCCLREVAGVCVECPKGTHLYRKNCLTDLPHCLGYLDGFACRACEDGYRVADDGTCVFKDQGVPRDGFVAVEPGEWGNELLAKIIGTFKQKYNKLGDTQPYLVYTRRQTSNPGPQTLSNIESFHIRIIYTSSIGLIETLFLFQPPSQGAPAGQLGQLLEKIYRKEDAEDFVVEGGEIQRLFQAVKRGDDGAGGQVYWLDAYRKRDGLAGGNGRMLVGQASQYRVFIVTQDTGIEQIPISLDSPAASQWTQLPIPQIPPDINTLITRIQQSPTFTKYLQNTTLKRITKQSSPYPQAYNVTYSHGDGGQSYFLFQVYGDQGRVVVRKSYMLLRDGKIGGGGTGAGKTVSKGVNVMDKTEVRANEAGLQKVQPITSDNSILYAADDAGLPMLVANPTPTTSIVFNPTPKNNLVVSPANSLASSGLNTVASPNTNLNPIPARTVNSSLIRGSTASAPKPITSSSTSPSTSTASSVPVPNPVGASSPSPSPSPSSSPSTPTPAPAPSLPPFNLSQLFNPKLPSSGTPTLKPITSDLQYSQYIDIMQFYKTSIYDSISKFLQKFYSGRTVGSEIVRVSLAQNITTFIIDLVYKVYTFDQSNDFYTFAIDKASNEMQLIRMYSVPKSDRTFYNCDENTRNTIITNLDNNTRSLITGVITGQPIFSPKAKIFQINSYKYRTKYRQADTPSQTWQHKLKYYYPAQLQLPFQYVEFRYQLLGGAGRKSLGNILFPKEEFVEVGVNRTDIFGIVKSYVASQVMEGIVRGQLGQDYGGFKLVQIMESMRRAGYYRVQVQVDDKYIAYYEININNYALPRLLSNQSIEVKPVEPEPVPAPEPRYTIYFYKEYFPFYRVRPIVVPILYMNSLDIVEPSQSQIKDIIFEFFSIAPENIYNLRILGRQVSFDGIELYTLDFREGYKTRRNIRENFVVTYSEPRRFVIQVVRREAKSQPVNGTALKTTSTTGIDQAKAKSFVASPVTFTVSTNTEVANPTFTSGQLVINQKATSKPGRRLFTKP